MKTLKIILFLNLVLIVLSINSCGDEIVTTVQEEFDSARFEWRTVIVPGGGYTDIWASDTNSIYLLNYYTNELILVRNGIIQRYNIGNYGLSKIGGVTDNEIYIFAASAYPENNLTIIKFDGAAFSYYPTGIIIGAINNEGYWVKGLVSNPYEIWICSQKGIAKFDGVNIFPYTYDDSTMIPIDMFISNDNKVQYICEKSTQNNISQSLYEFQDSGFVKLFNYSRDPNINMSYIFLRQINGFKYGLELNRPFAQSWTTCIQDFTGSAFSGNYCFNDQIQTPHPLTRTNNPVGENLQNFVSIVEAKDGFFEHTRIGVVNWNGNKFSREFELTSSGILEQDGYLIYKIKNGNYLILQPKATNYGDCILHISSAK